MRHIAFLFPCHFFKDLPETAFGETLPARNHTIRRPCYTSPALWNYRHGGRAKNLAFSKNFLIFCSAEGQMADGGFFVFRFSLLHKKTPSLTWGFFH
jgi:hypothetical protein